MVLGTAVSNIGDSMNPVLHNGDIVLVNRLIYDTSTPKRNDIIVFRPNGNENAHASIKRIVGLPGETIQLKDNAVYINGEKLKEDFQDNRDQRCRDCRGRAGAWRR